MRARNGPGNNIHALSEMHLATIRPRSITPHALYRALSRQLCMPTLCASRPICSPSRVWYKLSYSAILAHTFSFPTHNPPHPHKPASTPLRGRRHEHVHPNHPNILPLTCKAVELVVAPDLIWLQRRVAHGTCVPQIHCLLQAAVAKPMPTGAWWDAGMSTHTSTAKAEEVYGRRMPEMKKKWRLLKRAKKGGEREGVLRDLEVMWETELEEGGHEIGIIQ